MDTRAHYLQLAGKIDAFFAEVLATYRAHMQCGPRCSDCCHSRFSVTLVEAEYIAEGVASLGLDIRDRLRTRAVSDDRGRCAALDSDGMCEIHPWRPIICRSHGAPISFPAESSPRPDAEPPAADRRVHLPVIEVCPKNFQTGFDDLDARMVLDQSTVSTVLGAIDAAHADSRDIARGTRIAIADILAQQSSCTE